MKKLLMLTSTLLLLFTLSGATHAATREIPIESLSGSSNTASATPVEYLADDHLETIWETTEQTPGTAWVEMRLSEPEQVEGLQIYGPYTGQITVEYWQDGTWYHFITADHLQAQPSLTGWNLIDLSYDRIVTDRVRLWFTNPDQAPKLGGIAELKLLGRPVREIMQRFDPVAVSTNRDTQKEHPAQYLFDHNTYTAWSVPPGTSQALVAADLGEPCVIERIKIYGNSEDQAKGRGKFGGQFKLQYRLNHNWLDLPGMSSGHEIPVAWQTIDLLSPITTSKIRLVMTGPAQMGLREIEIWGRQLQPTGSRYLQISQDPVPVKDAVNYAFTIKNPLTGSATFHLAAEGVSSSLSWELNGRPMPDLTPFTSIRGFVIYQQTLSSEDFRKGLNFIRIYGENIGNGEVRSQESEVRSQEWENKSRNSEAGNGETEIIHDCRLELTPTDNCIVAGNNLTDRYLLTPTSGGEQTIDLNGTWHLDELILSYSGNPPQVQVAIEQNGEWVSLTDAPKNETGVLGGELVYAKVGLARQIRVTGGLLNGLTELRINGSPVAGGPPRVRIVTPGDGEILSLTEWTGMKLTGTVDNPRAELRVNGQLVETDGTDFEFPLAQLGLKVNEEKTIRVTATDSQGRTGADQVTVTIGIPPEFTVNLPEQIVYTRETQIAVTGKVSAPTGSVTVNGIEAVMTNQKFSAIIPLQEGLNLITVKVTPVTHRKFSNFKQFRVVRTSAPPFLKVVSPVDGQTVKEDQLIISGETSGLTPVTVSVNGQPAPVASGRFYSNPVTLAEGENRISVVATGQMGLCSKIDLSVWKDQAAPVLDEVLPGEGAMANTANLMVTGKINDNSPACVLVNGRAALVNGGQFSVTVPVNEGWNDLKITARDSAGNSAALNRRVWLDTQPPLAFSPLANPTGWSSNNRPGLTFATTDLQTGMDHYELRVDNGNWNRVASPYQFPSAIPDGEHTIQVKAFDKAGNTTTGEARVYIDTTVPAIPEGFEVISGIAQVTLNWIDPHGEISAYRIHRTPAFPEGSLRERVRAPEANELSRFIDQEVTPGADYAYTLQAIDHGGNRGAVTGELTVKVGIATREVSSPGGTVKFDRCEVSLPEGALAETGQIRVREETATLPENEFAIPASPTYNFSLLDQAGREVPATFAEPVTLTVSYADLQITAGFDANCLGVYWFNEEGGYWEKLENVVNDPSSQTLSVPVGHFSDYKVMASNYVSPSLDSYYDLGVSPFQSYFKENVESVSPSSGSLTVTATDLRLPGRNGFDLVLKRIYDSAAAEQEKIYENNSCGLNSTKCPEGATIQPKAPVNTFGCGWSLNLPWIEVSDKGYFLRLPEGQTIKIEFKRNCFEYHEGTHFTLQREVTPCSGLQLSQNIKGYVLTMADGTTYEFGGLGKVYRQKDPTGKNVIEYQYDGRELTRITDSLGRAVNFTYGTMGTKRMITRIETGDRKIQYDYNNSGELTGVHDPLKRVTGYAYQSFNLEEQTPNQPGYKINPNLLNVITYPTGGISVYTYEIRKPTHTERNSDGIYITSKSYKVLVAKQEVAGKAVSYIYRMNQESGILANGGFIPADKYMLSCQIIEGERTSTETYLQLVRDLKWNNNEGDYHLTGIDDYLKKYNNYSYKGTMAASRRTLKSGVEVEQVNYQYDLPLRAITQEEHLRANELTYQITSQYDAWGNLTSRADGSRNLEETWKYHEHSTIKNLVEETVKKNHNPLTGTVSLVTTTYEYDDNLGKPLKMTVNDGTQKLETKFTYDDYGNLSTRIDPNGLTTEIFYDVLKQAFPRKKVVYGVKDADGKATDITTHYGYNWETGLKDWEKDPRQFVTSYQYDLLNRVIKVTLPDDDGIETNNPYREYDFDDTNNTCLLTNEKGQQTRFVFDPLGRLTKVVKLTSGTRYPAAVKTVYTYDEQGRIGTVTDPRGLITEYRYDGLNRVTKVIYPDQTNVTLQYDDVTNTVTITDENGNKVTERSDWANRLVEAKQDCVFAGTEVYTWKFTYDSLGNKLRQVDPLKHQVNQEFDPLGHLVGVKLPSALLMMPGGELPANNQPELAYEYDKMGNKVKETNANQNMLLYDWDELGRLIKVTAQAKDVFTGVTVTSVTKTFYDECGNKVKMVDPNLGEWIYAYSARGFLLSEQDPAGNVRRYKYDELGNKIAVTDPRGDGVDGRFTTWYEYDELNRLAKTFLPDNTPAVLTDNPYTEITYDLVGNKLSERDAGGVVTHYEYSPRNRVLRVIDNHNRVQKEFTYDKKGNQTEVKDIFNHVTRSEYDSLGRLRRVTDPLQNQENYTYDPVGNRLAVEDERGNVTRYTYNELGWLTGVTDPLANQTQYRYDPGGNQVAVIAANNLVTTNSYDGMNRLVERVDPLQNSTKVSYDKAGNKLKVKDPRGTVWDYQYFSNNLLKQVDLTGADKSAYMVEYQYDAAGNRVQVHDSGNTINYNLEDGVYLADPLNRTSSVDRSFDQVTYRTEYQYNTAGLLTGIKYPGASEWLEYHYNDLNQLDEVVGFTKPPEQQGIVYRNDGTLHSLTYANGVAAVYDYDFNGRLKDLNITSLGKEVLHLNYDYDPVGNITRMNDKVYDYDKNSQLVRAYTPGKFMEQSPTPGTCGLKVGDYLGLSWMCFMPVEQVLLGIDYDATSIGMDFGTVVPGIKKIELVPDKGYQVHRLTGSALDLYTSEDNLSYGLVARSKWEYGKDSNGVITITLKEVLAARYLKLHVKYDNRDQRFKPVKKAEFLNKLAKMMRVYQEAGSRTEEYQYDSVGNRMLQRVKLVQSERRDSSYYAKSNRLKTDGKLAYKYDNAGNLVEKGNVFEIDGESVEFTESGVGVEYWLYEYDLLNRLIRVKKNGNIVAEYGYDPEGLRVVKRAHGETTHFVFEGTEPIFEKRITGSTSRIRSYVFGLGKHLARVDGHEETIDGKVVQIIDKKYWYSTDHLGSVRAVTDSTGTVVWNADYLAFGSKYGENGNFDEKHGFTGKELDLDTGLYYFNARWYDSELGRFISEDPAMDPNNPNLYSYGSNNPIGFTDPTGKEIVNITGGEVPNNWPDQPAEPGPAPPTPSGSTPSPTPSPPTVTDPKTVTQTVDKDKVDKAYKQITDQYKDLKDLKPEDVKRIAAGLNDAERLYLGLKIAHDNPDFVAGFKGDPAKWPKWVKDAKYDDKHPTWCNAYAAYALYLFSGDKDLMSSNADPAKFKNFSDPTAGWPGPNWCLPCGEQKSVVSDPKSGWKEVTAQEAQKLANEGKFAIAIEPSHIAVVSPGEGTTNKLGAFCPAVGQEGKSNLLYGVTNKGTMANSWVADDYKSVKFYVKL
jgi:RHS repeat-associated protein